ERPARGGAQVERQYRAAGPDGGRQIGDCLAAVCGESQVSHGWSPLLVGCSRGRRRRSGAWRYVAAGVGAGGLGGDEPRARNPWGWAWENPPAAFSPTPVGGGFTPETGKPHQHTDKEWKFQFRECACG